MAKYKKRNDGRYEAKVNIGTRADGSYARKAIYGNTIAELEENVRQAKNRHEQGVDLIAQKPTVKAWAEKWLSVYKADVGRSLRANYASNIRKWLAPIHELKIDKVRQIQLQEILQSASAVLAQKSVNQLYDCIRGVFSTARQNGLLAVDVSASLAKPSGGPKARRDALTYEEQEIIVRISKDAEDGLLPMIMLYAGLRLGEALALTHGDLKDGYVNVNKTVVYEENSNKASIKGSPKTDAGFRKIPIVRPLEEFIKASRNADGPLPHESSLVFSKDGQPYSKTVSRRLWEKLMDNYREDWKSRRGQNATGSLTVVPAAPRNITAHMLRHTFVTSLYDAGIDLKTAQRWSGHSTVTVLLDIYTHLSEGKEKESETKLKNFFDRQEIDDNFDDNFDDNDDKMTTKIAV